MVRSILVAAVLLASGLQSVGGQQPNAPASGLRVGEQSASAEDLRHFETHIRRALVKYCLKCHSASAGRTESGLALDSRDGLRRGGDRGPALAPGDSESLLLQAIRHTDPDLRMPPGRKLPAKTIAAFAEWVRRGAVDPRTNVPIARVGVDIEAGREFWAFRPPRQPAQPTVTDSDWAVDLIDRFVLQRLDEAGLAPSPDADATTLLRRIHFDLVGLPPTRQRRDAFLQAVAERGLESALPSLVDELLASAQYGERWGRHWLDVARFAESSGKETNVTFPHAWRYRDYVIDSFNRDKGFDRFLLEQIAGDLLPAENDDQRAEHLVATGFLAVGPRGLNEMNRFQFIADVIDEQIDTTTRAVMASSVACARCHDHKFDPFSMRDYYALAGVFASTKTFIGTSVAPGNQVGGDLLQLPRLSQQLIPNKGMPAARVRKLKDELAALKQEERDGRAAAMKAAAEGRDPTEFFSLRDALRILWRSGGIVGQLKTVDDEGHPYPLCMGASDREEIIDAPLLERGEITRAGDRVPRGFPEVVDLPSEVSPGESGRREFAEWLTHPDHPLTARVMANRVWSHLFGRGLVGTVDNFGRNGERPTHPQLLDHLALSLRDNGWSLKTFIRRLVLSRTYRQSSHFREDCFRVDPDNRLLWRASQRRLDAEVIRDAMLAASGQLDLRRPPASLVARLGDRPVSIFGFIKQVPPDLDGAVHRSVYLPVIRDRLPDALELFDFAEPSLVTGRRDTTNVPLQALYFMNGRLVREQSAALATRVLGESTSPRECVRIAFEICLARPPDEFEQQAGTHFLTAALAADPQSQGRLQRAMTGYCQALFSTAEFRNLD